RGRLRRDRAARRARVPLPRVPVPAQQSPHRPLRRLAREPDAVPRRGAGGGAHGGRLAGGGRYPARRRRRAPAGGGGSRAAAPRLERAAPVDFLDVSVGLSGAGMVRPLYTPHAFGVYAAATVKRAVERTPVFTVHRILMPEEAEGILSRGDADAVTLVRALIADPEWPAKAHAGAADTIRRCTGTNQGCYGNLLQGLPVTCVTNPEVGREDVLGA